MFTGPLVEQDGEEFIASTDDPPVYGVGSTREAAIADYNRALEEYRGSYKADTE